jgi:hypothetical protein
VDADADLGGEGTLGDLAVDRGPGQAGAGEDGFETDDTVLLMHGWSGSGWWPLAAADTDRTRRCVGASALGASSQNGAAAAADRRASASEALLPAEVEAVTEGKLLPELHRRIQIHADAELPLAALQQGFHLRIALEAPGHVAHRRP